MSRQYARNGSYNSRRSIQHFVVGFGSTSMTGTWVPLCNRIWVFGELPNLGIAPHGKCRSCNVHVLSCWLSADGLIPMTSISALAEKVFADSRALGYGFDSSRRPGDLWPEEFFWRKHHAWLQDRGYLLRPRYQPGWTPSWTLPGAKKDWQDCEDGQYQSVCPAGGIVHAKAELRYMELDCVYA
jgi:hypothetical protein